MNDERNPVLRPKRRRRRRRAKAVGIRWTEQTATWVAQHTMGMAIVSAWLIAHVVGPFFLGIERGNTSFVDTAFGALIAYYFPRGDTNAKTSDTREAEDREREREERRT